LGGALSPNCSPAPSFGLTRSSITWSGATPKAELKARIMHYLQDLNSDPVVFRWRYKLEEESVS
jgi:hypothetical protein